MSDTQNLIAARLLPDALKAISLIEPPAWTRLEPQSVSGDPSPGLNAAALDPLWLLGRQWQFGEFAGEDAGTPLGVAIEFASEPLTAWQPGDPAGGGPVLPLSPDDPLEPTVEAEPGIARGPGWRMRAEAGHLLLRELARAQFDARSALLAACPLPVDEPAPDGVTEAQWPRPRVWRTIARANPDGEQAARSLETAGAAGPGWLAGAPPAAVEAAAAWLAWYRASVSPPAEQAVDAWIDERIEYRFSVRIGEAARQRVLVAPLHDGATIDWYTFDVDPARVMQLPGEAAGNGPRPGSGRTVAARVDPRVALRPARGSSTPTMRMLASPLRYAGMPSDRLWQFEDGSVNLGRLEVQAHDLARLCFVEFAMVYGSDWFTVPLDCPAGAFTTVRSLVYTTTFGESIKVFAADDRSRGGRFRLFEHNLLGKDQTVDGLLVPPTARGTLEGRPLEDVLLLRDESANMAWAVERTVQGPGGDPRARGDEPGPEEPHRDMLPGTELQYLFASTVPAHWIPLVPTPLPRNGGRRGAFVLRKGTMTDRDEAMSVLLRATPFDLKDEEVPRDGVRVRRIPAMARASDGTRLRWIARRVSIGRGEGTGNLRFDDARR